MRLFIILILFSLLLIEIFADENKLDSINVVLGSHEPDSVKIDHLNDLNLSLFMNYPGKMFLLADTAINLSIKTNDSLRLAQSYNRKGVACYFLGDLNNAFNYFLKAVNIKENLNKYELLIPEYNNIGMVLRSLGQPNESLRYYLMALEISIENKDEKDNSKIWNNLGTNYRQLKQFDKAKEAYIQALASNVSMYDFEAYVITLNNLGNLYKEIKEYQKALYYYNKALSYVSQSDNYYVRGLIHNNLSELYLFMENFNDANNNLIVASKMINKIGSVNLRISNLKLWSEYYERLNKSNEALIFRKDYQRMTDSLSINERALMFENLKAIAESERKLKEYTLLKTLNSIQEKQLANNRFIQLLALLFSILLIISILLLIKYLGVKNKLNFSLQKLVKEKTSELEKAKIHAEQSDNLKSAFLTNISHEVRTPMNAIIGFSNLLNYPDIDENERKQFLLHINNNTYRLLKIFENITHLAKFEQNDVVLKNITFNPHNVIEKIIEKANDNPQTASHTQRVKNLVPAYLNLLGDKDILSMVMEEVLDNAIKFTNSGDIVISSYLNEFNYYISVEDTGIGIKKEQLPYVFDKFSKFEKSLIPEYDGPGIGLSLVKRCIEFMGGKVDIESKKMKGTKVTISIPVK